MQAIVFSEPSNSLQLVSDHPIPQPGPGEALIRVLRAGICSTDLEIISGYVPGFHFALGHEFVGTVAECASRPDLVGKRVVGEINVNKEHFSCADAVYVRNHAPGRVVLGIIGKDGAMSQYVTLPVENLHEVPEALTDTEACFSEPLAAACRVIEQRAANPGDKVAVIGDGKLGLLVAQVLVEHGGCPVTLFGRHSEKVGLVSGLHEAVVAPPSASSSSNCGSNGSGGDGQAQPQAQQPQGSGVDTRFEGTFDVVVEASGSSRGIRTALALVRPMGTVVCKTTVSLKDPHMPGWSELANDIVVNEKRLLGSRCGPFDLALRMLASSPALRRLVNGMVSGVFPVDQGLEAIEAARRKGALKVQVSFP